MKILVQALSCFLVICGLVASSQDRRGFCGSDEQPAVAATYLAQANTANRAGQAARRLYRNLQTVGGKDNIGQKPLTEMSANDRYKGQDGGLYGGGRNEPPEAHRRAATAALEMIKPLNAAGHSAQNGIVGLVSISMSNATMEFSMFKQLADADSAKSSHVTIVDCAQGGQAMAEWVDPKARPWQEASHRLAMVNVTPAQIQVAWIKLANKGPRGELEEHGHNLESDTLAVIQNAKSQFTNLRVAYLSSRIYGGYATTPLNPEPYAYESGFVVRWLIQRQINGDKALNCDLKHGEVRAPVLLWGPYLWADGVTPRKADGLVYRREDLGPDGTHPSPAGREKVAKLLLNFFKTDPLAKSWFTKKLSGNAGLEPARNAR